MDDGMAEEWYRSDGVRFRIVDQVEKMLGGMLAGSPHALCCLIEVRSYC